MSELSEQPAQTLEELKEKIAAALRERDAEIAALQQQRDALRQMYDRAISALNDRLIFFPRHRPECKPGKCVCGLTKGRAALAEALRLGTLKECPKCQGCGQVANTEGQEPWTHWTRLPLESATAVVAGLVKPISCPRCDGTGRIPDEAETEKAANMG